MRQIEKHMQEDRKPCQNTRVVFDMITIDFLYYCWPHLEFSKGLSLCCPFCCFQAWCIIHQENTVCKVAPILLWHQSYVSYDQTQVFVPLVCCTLCPIFVWLTNIYILWTSREGCHSQALPNQLEGIHSPKQNDPTTIIYRSSQGTSIQGFTI